MNRKLWRIPLLALTTGIACRAVTTVTIVFLARGTNEWTQQLDRQAGWILGCTAVLLFLIGGYFGMRGISRRDAVHSAILTSGYWLAVLLFKKVLSFSGLSGAVPFVSGVLLLPLDVYTRIYGTLLRLTMQSPWDGSWMIWPCLLLPFVYVLFARPKKALAQNTAETVTE